MALINCKECGKEISDKAASCPNCGCPVKDENVENKNDNNGSINIVETNIKKRRRTGKIIITIILAIFVGLYLIGSKDEKVEKETEQSENVSSEVSEEAEEEMMTISVVKSYEWIAENDEPSFLISQDSILFMEEHPDFFPGNENIQGQISDYVDFEVGYVQLAKSISKYDQALISVSGIITDITETEDGSLTYMQVMDWEGNSYVLYYLGVLEEAFVDVEIYGYALPLSMITFENMGGAYTEAVACAACYIEVYSYDEEYYY